MSYLRASLTGITLAFAGSSAVSAQGPWRGVMFTGGVSVEGYQGNLAAVTVPLVDSTENATAGVGEFGARGMLSLIETERRGLLFSFDGGLRQFAATGFELRDYAPREWVGSLDAQFREALGSWGVLRVGARIKGRRVQDRPPIPLFLQPGYGSARGSLGLDLRAIRGVRFDAELSGEVSDYRALVFTPQLDLLDRNAGRIELGAAFGERLSVRFFTALQAAHYERQGTFDPGDPFRRDQSVQGGVFLTLPSPIYARVGVEGTLNRSNSKRPEYDAMSAQALVAFPLFWDVGANVYGVLTRKNYLSKTGFALLVPGEEADNASVVYLQLIRPLAPNLDGSVRLGWTRAETDIGGAYFQRYGAAFFLHFRP